MEAFKITRGKGWNVFLSDKRLFVVNAGNGVRTVDFNVDENLLDALREALKPDDEIQQTAVTKKKTRKKSEE